MNKKIISLVLLSSVFLIADVDLQKNMYDSAQEMMAMDEKMNKAIAEHNRLNPNWDDPIEIEVLSVNDFEDRGDSYVLEREIDDMNQTTVDVKLENGKLTISTTTSTIIKTALSEEKTMNSSSSSLILPNDADESQMEKSYENGLLKITFPKK